MKISKKEKLLLIMLVAILGSVVYYQFVHTKQKEELVALEQQYQEVQSRYNEIIETISTLEKRQKQINLSYSGILENSKQYYPNLIQEKLILEIDQLLKENLISANISFTEVTTEGVEAFQGASSQRTASSIQSLIDQYGTSATISEASGGSEETPDSSIATVEQMKLAVSFNTTYEALKSFLYQAQEYERQLVITNITITPGLNDSVSGSFNLELYAFPKFEGVDEDYLDWTLENTYGKSTPFSSGAATGAYSDEVEADVETESDFVISLKSTTSTLPTFMMGASGDEHKDSYIMSENKEILNVTLTLSQDGEAYAYRYETNESSYPETGTVNFTPQESINLQINSEARVTTDDVSGIKLTIVNETDKKVMITIENDDQTNPRVSISADTTKTEIIKK